MRDIHTDRFYSGKLSQGFQQPSCNSTTIVPTVTTPVQGTNADLRSASLLLRGPAENRHIITPQPPQRPAVTTESVSVILKSVCGARLVLTAGDCNANLSLREENQRGDQRTGSSAEISISLIKFGP